MKITNIQHHKKLTFPLNVYAFVSYFMTNEFRDITELQKNITKLIFRHLHKSPRKILGVGSGLSEMQQQLFDKGFEYIGITADKTEFDLAKKILPNASVYHTRFEDFTDESNRYYAILFQNSAQNIYSDILFNQCNTLLSNDGRIFIVDVFSMKEDDTRTIENFKEEAAKYGFAVSTAIDLSEEAKRSAHFLSKQIKKYKQRLIETLNSSEKMIDDLLKTLDEKYIRYEREENKYFFLELRKITDFDHTLATRNNKKKALILTTLTLSKVGGIEKINNNIKTLLEDHDWTVDALCTEDIREEYTSDYFLKMENPLEQYFAFASVTNWKSYDLVVTNNYTGGLCHTTNSTRVVRISHGIVSAVENEAGEESYLKKFFPVDLVQMFSLIEEASYTNDNITVSVSPQVGRELKDLFGRESRVVVNGFDFEKFSKLKNDFRQKNNIPTDAIVGIFAARMDPFQKRPQITIELASKYPEIYWIFATDKHDPRFDALKNIVVTLNVPYDEMPVLYSAANFAIQLSVYEGFSNFAMESIACALPMISTKTGIITDVYQNTEMETLLIDQNFDESIVLANASQKIDLLLSDYDRYQKECEYILPQVKEAFSIENWGKEMLNVLDPRTKYRSENNLISEIKTILFNTKTTLDKKMTKEAIDLLLHENKLNSRESVYHLFKEILLKTEDQTFFYTTLSDKLLKSASWFDYLDINHTSPTMDLLMYICSTNPQLLMQSGVIGRVCAKFINIKEHAKVIHPLENISIPKDNYSLQWLLFIAKLNLKMDISETPKVLMPDDIFMKNTVFHFRHSTSKCFIFFTSMDVDGTGILLMSFKEILEHLGISLVIVYDPDVKMSLTGLGGLTLKQSISEMKKHIIDDLGYEHVTTFGFSGNGLAALIYGLEMNIDAVLGFSIFTERSIEKIIGKHDLDDFYNSVYSHLSTKKFNQEQMDEFSLLIFGKENYPHLDAKDFLVKNKSTQIYIYYADNFEPDIIAAERIGSFGNVHLIPEEHDDHFLLAKIYRDNLLDKYLKEFFRKIKWL